MPRMTKTIPDSVATRAQSGAVNDTDDPDPEVPERARGPRRYSAKYKAEILDEYEVWTRRARVRCCAARACTRR